MRWQLGSRLLDCPVIQPFVNQSCLIVESGMVGATGNIYVGLHEFVEMSFVLHLLRHDDLFLDLGANVGSYTVLSSAVAGASTIACEPILATFERLERNIRYNRLENLVMSRRTAIGGSNGTLPFIADQDAMNRVATEAYRGVVVEVPVTTIDTLMNAVTSPAGITLWKADLEGYEEEMLSGAVNTLQTRPPEAIVIESNSTRVRNTLESNCYTPVDYDPFTRELKNTNALTVRRNYFWVHSQTRDLVAERLATAHTFEVHGHCI